MKNRMIFSRTAELLDRWGLRPYLLKLSDYMYHPRRSAGYDLDILRDYRSFRQQYAELLNGDSSRQSYTKRLLIVSLSPVYYRIKLEIVLARALQLRGYQPYFLTHKSLWVPNYPARYFRSARFGTTIFLEDYLRLSSASLAEVRRVVRRTLTDSLTVESLRNFEYRDVQVGDHVLSSLSRTLHQGRIDVTQPKATAFLRRVLPEALENVWAAETLLDTVQPDIVLFNDTSYVHYGPICDVTLARGINTIQFMWGFEDDALFLKRCTPETRRQDPRKRAWWLPGIQPRRSAWAWSLRWRQRRRQNR